MRRLSFLFLTLVLLLFSSEITRAEEEQQDQVDEQDEAEDENQNDNYQYDDEENDADEEDADENEQGDDVAEEEENDDEDGDDQEGNDAAAEEQTEEGDDAAVEEQADEAEEAGDEDAGDDGYYRNQVQVCSDAIIEVQDVVVYCDSPGTYYYGSGKYRNSQYCQPGDKAKIQIDFYIADHDTIQQAGNYALVNVYADGDYYSDSVTVYENADLCSLSSLKKKSGSTCPYNGYYQIKTQFDWTNSDYSQQAFLPTIHVGFKSSLNVDAYDFGGANTDLCRGSSFVTWSNGVKVSYANAMSNFMRSFGILLCTILVMGVFIWLLAKRPTSMTEAKLHLIGRGRRNRDLSIHQDEEFDFRKIQGNRDLMDF